MTITFVSETAVRLPGAAAEEVVEALPADGHPVVGSARRGVRIGRLHLTCDGPGHPPAGDGRKPRRRPPAVFTSARLYAPDMESTR